MTPAVQLLKKSGDWFKTHEYAHDPDTQSYGMEAAAKLSLNESSVFKTLIVETETKKLAVAVVPVAGSLDLKAMAKALGCKKAAMADHQAAQRATGYLLGGISPLGQKKRLATIIDRSAEGQETIFVSGGRRGLEVELQPDTLADHCRARFCPIAKA